MATHGPGRAGSPDRRGAGPLAFYCAVRGLVEWLLRRLLPVLGGAVALWLITGMPGLRW
jgi:hypothetical protein